ncbi:Sec1 family domain-containing protein MIP3 [Striga hermonthica]|uniref:Sec1 family domain-containing protein MIP3 n=1 Tax=Striga hermonthica TaxID=68872 RepID=A0A9N7RJW6_STRHE|nr:Sec1 family domain-containing protein MIP3 [Striga hermonthica]
MPLWIHSQRALNTRSNLPKPVVSPNSSPPSLSPSSLDNFLVGKALSILKLYNLSPLDPLLISFTPQSVPFFPNDNKGDLVFSCLRDTYQAFGSSFAVFDLQTLITSKSANVSLWIMATVDVINCCLDTIRQLSENIEDAIVYLDAGSSESFEFLGAFPLFLELGARAVCSLENISTLEKVVSWNPNSDPARKIVVFTSRLVSDAHRYILRCLSTLQTVHHCAVYTSVSEVAHSSFPESPLGPDAFREYESLLKQDYEELVKKHETDGTVSGNDSLKESTAFEDEGWSHLTSFEDDISRSDGISSNKLPKEDNFTGYSEDVGGKLSVSVHHFPLILCPLSPRVFVLPSEGYIAEASLSTDHENSVSSGLPPISAGNLVNIEDISPGATLTAQFLYHLALKMDLKLEIYSLGNLSKNVGKLLTDMSSLYDVGRRKKTAGLLLIDRTLDLLTPCCHGDSLVDRMFSSLPRRRRITFSNQMKGSQSQLKSGLVKLERAPLAVQVPLGKIITEKDSKCDFQLLDSIEAFLHGWNAIDSDVQSVELMKFSKKLNDENWPHNQGELLHGSFVSTDNFRGAPYLEAILERRTKDGVMLMKKWLQESLRQEKISSNVKIRPGFPSKSDLQCMVKALSKSQSTFIKNKGIIQLAAVTLHALDESHSANWDAFNSAEKILHVNAADTSQSLAAQISDLINKTSLAASQNKVEKSQGLFSLEDALLLTIIGYLLAGENFPTSGSGGPFSWQEEHFMKEGIVDSVLENPAASKLKFLQGLSQELEDSSKKPKSNEKKHDPSDHSDGVDFDDDQWGNWGDDNDDGDDKDTGKEEVYGNMQLKLELRDRVDNLFKFLHKLSSLKSKASLLALESRHIDDPLSGKCFLYRILTRILDKNDIPGLEYHSSTVGRLFKSGLGRFGLGQVKPSLVEQNVILVFVIGGINAVEVREVQEALTGSSRPDVEIILGGTTFLTPDDMRELLLGDYSHI